MKSVLQRTAALTVSLCLLLCCLLPLTAGAAGADPVDPVWEGTTAKWKPPAKTTAYYFLALYKDGVYLSDTTTTATSYDFGSQLSQSGSGDYQYTVSAVFDDTSQSQTVSSSVYTYTAAHVHSLTHVDAKQPTCTETGVKEHYECSGCGKYFQDAAALAEITDKNEVVLAAKGHSWGEWQVTKQATATAEGEERRVCTVDASHVETRAIPMLTTATTSATTIAATEATEQASSAAETTQAGAVTVTQTTIPKNKLTFQSDKQPEESGNTIFGMPAGFFWVLAIMAFLLFVVVPAVLITVLVISKKKKNQPKPQHEARMNGSEYLPPENNQGDS